MRTGRTERADALRNRHALVDAARAEIAEVGLDVSVNAVVRRAGVGSATFYRRFASRDELLAAVLVEVIAELEAEAALALEVGDPREGLRHLLLALIRRQIDNKGLTEALGAAVETTEIDEARSRLRELVREVVVRAIDEGVVRSDFSWEDLPFAAGALATMPASCLGLDHADTARRRLLDVVLDGLAPR